MPPKLPLPRGWKPLGVSGDGSDEEGGMKKESPREKGTPRATSVQSGPVSGVLSRPLDMPWWDARRGATFSLLAHRMVGRAPHVPCNGAARRFIPAARRHPRGAHTRTGSVGPETAPAPRLEAPRLLRGLKTHAG